MPIINIIPASTPQGCRDEIVKILKSWASNHRVQAFNSSRVAARMEHTHMAAAYQGAAEFFNNCEVK